MAHIGNSARLAIILDRVKAAHPLPALFTLDELQGLAWASIYVYAQLRGVKVQRRTVESYAITIRMVSESPEIAARRKAVNAQRNGEKSHSFRAKVGFNAALREERSSNPTMSKPHGNCNCCSCRGVDHFIENPITNGDIAAVYQAEQRRERFSIQSEFRKGKG